MTDSRTAGVPHAAAHPFDEAVALDPAPDGRLRGRTHEAYWNMVSPFGGVTAAVSLNALLMQRERIGDPVSLTVNFVAPVQPGEYYVEPRLVRSNRSTQHWAVQIVQGGEVTTSAIAFFAVRRPVWGITEAAPPAAPGTAERYRGSGRLRWLSMYDVRYVHGKLGQENDDSITHSWIGDVPARPVDFLSLVAYCDTFAPRLFLRRPQWVPIGTVSFNVYFHVGAEELKGQGAEPVLGVAQGQVAHGGYFDQQGQIWGRGGRLLATTQQIVWYKE